MSNAVRGGEVGPGGIVRAAGAGTMAAVIAGSLTVNSLARTAEDPVGTAVGAVLLVALMAAFSYRQVGALVSAGAVLAGLGAVQLFMVQTALLAADQTIRLFAVLDLASTLLMLGGILLGAGAGWAALRSFDLPRWSHYGGLKLGGSLALGVLAGWILLWSLSLLYADDDVVSWGIIPIIAASALAVGAVFALSPVGALPALVALAVMAFSSNAPFWGSPLMFIMIVLLGTVVHFIGPLSGEPARGDGAESWESWISRGHGDGGGAGAGASGDAGDDGAASPR